MFDIENSHKRILQGIDQNRDAAAKALKEDVPAVLHVQGGRPCLVASCPQCGTPAGLSEPAPTNGEGMHFCRRCHILLRFVAEKETQAGAVAAK